MQVLFETMVQIKQKRGETMVQIKQKRGIGVENPSPRSFSDGVHPKVLSHKTILEIMSMC